MINLEVYYHHRTCRDFQYNACNKFSFPIFNCLNMVLDFDNLAYGYIVCLNCMIISFFNFFPILINMQLVIFAHTNPLFCLIIFCCIPFYAWMELEIELWLLSLAFALKILSKQQARWQKTKHKNQKCICYQLVYKY